MIVLIKKGRYNLAIVKHVDSYINTFSLGDITLSAFNLYLLGFHYCELIYPLDTSIYSFVLNRNQSFAYLIQVYLNFLTVFVA